MSEKAVTIMNLIISILGMGLVYFLIRLEFEPQPHDLFLYIVGVVITFLYTQAWCYDNRFIK